MIYLDANVFIYAAIDDGEIGEKARAILKKQIKEKREAATCCLTWDEVVYSIRKKLGKEISIEQGKNLLDISELRWLKVEENVIRKAHEIMVNYNLKPRDAIHAASSLINNIREIISDDPDFDKIEEIKRIKI